MDKLDPKLNHDDVVLLLALGKAKASLLVEWALRTNLTEWLYERQADTRQDAAQTAKLQACRLLGGSGLDYCHAQQTCTDTIQAAVNHV